MKHAVEMGSSAMVYVPSFIKIGSGIQKLMGGGTHRQHGDHISLLLFSQNKKRGLKLSLHQLNFLILKNYHLYFRRYFIAYVLCELFGLAVLSRMRNKSHVGY
jgi:hypothetical protein